MALESAPPVATGAVGLITLSIAILSVRSTLKAGRKSRQHEERMRPRDQQRQACADFLARVELTCQYDNLRQAEVTLDLTLAAGGRDTMERHRDDVWRNRAKGTPPPASNRQLG